MGLFKQKSQFFYQSPTLVSLQNHVHFCSSLELKKCLMYSLLSIHLKYLQPSNLIDVVIFIHIVIICNKNSFFVFVFWKSFSEIHFISWTNVKKMLNVVKQQYNLSWVSHSLMSEMKDLFALVRFCFKMKIILIYPGIFTAFQKRTVHTTQPKTHVTWPCFMQVQQLLYIFGCVVYFKWRDRNLFGFVKNV